MSATHLTNPVSEVSALGVPVDRERTSGILKIVFGFWVLSLFYPELFLTNTIGGPWFRIPTLLLPLLIWIVMQSGFGRNQYWPFSVLMVMHLYFAIFATNRGTATIWFKALVPFYLLMAASVALIKTPNQLMRVVTLFLLSFVWFAFFGVPGGRVTWHGQLANEDAFGPLMGMGIGLAYYVAMGTKDRRMKILGYLISGVCVVGVVAAFARGAVIAAAVVAIAIWLRSPRKLATLAGGGVAALLLMGATAILFPGGAFWNEMASISEGTESGTGQARWVMWMMAIDMWQSAPIFGIGAGNFGVVASQTVDVDMSRGAWQDPIWLYNQALHSVYFQLLAEAGIVGCFLWGYMVYDFHRIIIRLEKEPARRRWQEMGGTVDLKYLALGLESSMLCFHVNGVFYNQIYIHWFWTVLTLALVLARLTGTAQPDGSGNSPNGLEPRSPAPFT